VLVVLGGSCTDGESPTDPGRRGIVGLYLAPSFAVSAADASAQPVNRIRYSVVQAPESVQLVAGFEDVDPSASSWDLEISVPLGAPQASVVVLTQLIHVDDAGNEETEFAGTTDTIVLERGATAEPGAIDFVRGPLANLHVTDVRISAELVDLVEGESRTLVAETESDGTVEATSLVVYWTSLDAEVVGIDGTSLTAVAVGATEVVATVGALSDTVPVTVRGPVASLEIVPDSAVVAEGGSVALAVVAMSADGSVLEGVEALWSSEDPTVATVDEEGVVTGVALGTVEITAESEGVSASATVRVVLYVLSTEFATAANTELIAGEFPRPATPHAYTSSNVLSGTDDVEVTSTGEITTALGGSVEMEVDGDFRYRPPPGVAPGERDTFEVTSSGDVTSEIAIDITGAVWYVDNTADASGSGRSHHPFATLAEAEAAADADDVIYVAIGDGTASGLDQGITLLDGQHLIGAGVALAVDGIDGTLAERASPPVITASTGAAVTLANANRVAGLRIEDAAGAALEATAVSDGTLDSLSIVASNDVALRFTDTDGAWQSSHLDVTSSSAAGGLVVLRGAPVITFDIADGTFENLPGAGPAMSVEATTGGSVTVQGGDVHERGAGLTITDAAGDLHVASFLNVDTTSGPGIQATGTSGAMVFDDVDIATNGSEGIFTHTNPGTFDIAGRIEARGDYGWNGQCTSGPCGEINARFSAFLVDNDGTGVRSRAWFMARTPAFLEVDTLDVFVGEGWEVGAAIQLLDMSYGGSLTVTNPESRVVAPTVAGLDILAGTMLGNPTGINFTLEGTLAYIEGGDGLGFSGFTHCLCGVDGSLTVVDGLGFLQVGSGSLDLVYGGASGVALDGLVGSTVTLTGPSEGIELTNSASTSVLVEGTLTGTLLATGNVDSQIEATAADNSALSTSGPAVQIEDTGIGPAGVTFRSVSATSDPAAPSPGIVLRGTGTDGALTVTGSGAAGSGGSIDASAAPTSGDPEPAIVIDGSTTEGAFVGARADLSWLTVAASADTSGVEITDADVVVRNTTASGAATGLDVASAQPITVGVFDATFSGSGAAGVVVQVGPGSDVTLRNNTIDGVTCGNGILVNPTSGRHSVTLENNTIRNVGCDHGISVATSGPSVIGLPPTELALTVVGNDVLMPASSRRGLELAGRTGRTVMCYDVRGNAAVSGLEMAGIGINDDAPPDGQPIFLFERLLGGSGTTSDPGVVEAQLQQDNPGSTAFDETSADASGVPDGSCATYFDAPNPIPIAEPGGPYVAEVGDSVLFDGSGSTDVTPGRIVSYEWLVDGVSVSLSSGPTFQHFCSTEAQLLVELVVTDDRGDTSARQTLLDCQVTRFLGRWLDAAGDPITSTTVNEVVELQLCFLEDDLTAFQTDVLPFRWSFLARVDSVAGFDSALPGTHPDCAGNVDIVTEVGASSDLSADFTVTALSTAEGPGVGPQGILSLFFTFTSPTLFDETVHRDIFESVILETFDGDPPPFVIDIFDLTVN